ncbi:MAG TPA: hypothetical protein VH914_14790 [Acidimicrobiia bacterium]|nr:hypothetical protein [Acidimicrobiia bacterium]
MLESWQTFLRSRSTSSRPSSSPGSRAAAAVCIVGVLDAWVLLVEILR